MPLVAGGGFAMFRRIVLSAVGAGIITGLLVALIELLAVVPLIQKAELYEEGAAGQSTAAAPGAAAVDAAHEHSGHDHAAGSHESGRGFYTLVASVLTAIGYAFLLGALFSRMGSVSWKQGIAWGLAGFAVFQLAPALGLPPAPPGMAEADVSLRQTWWLGTVLASALGIAACYFAYRRKQAIWALVGMALIAAPHLIGAPQPVAGENLVPAELARTFTIAALLTAAVFWLLLGAVQGYLFSKLEQRGDAALAS